MYSHCSKIYERHERRAVLFHPLDMLLIRQTTVCKVIGFIRRDNRLGPRSPEKRGAEARGRSLISNQVDPTDCRQAAGRAGIGFRTRERTAHHLR